MHGPHDGRCDASLQLPQGVVAVDTHHRGWVTSLVDTREVVGVGDARIETKVEPATLHDVLHVPGLEFNIASVMKMDKKGARVVVQGGKCHVRLHG
jgi:hypothetical protein